MWLLSIRYGEMGLIGDFKTALPNLRRGEVCVITTDRGTEIGIVVSSPKPMPPDQPRAPNAPGVGKVLRRITPEDLKELDKINREKIPQKFAFCQQKIKELNIPINLVYMEHPLGGEKVILYFLAEGRVDFRELVKELAKEYKSRIEMRQIGVRDEARLLGDFEHCGQELCCKTFIKELQPVTMKMAKIQKTTMDPTKISGRCGRLMCCLRFENEIYTALKGKLPRKGSRIHTSKGTGDIVDLDILSQQMTIKLEGGNRLKVHASEIIETIRGPIKVTEPEEDED